MAYDCFERSAHEDAPTLFNQALCCFMIGWYEESYRRLGEAERLLDGIAGEGLCTGIPSALRRQPPETFRRWDADSELPRCPLLPEMPHDDALTLILRLAGRGGLPAGTLRGGADDCRPPRTPIQTP